MPVALCRALAENVLVVAFYDAGNAPSIDEANVLLHHDPSLTVIAFTTSDATAAAVVEPGDAGGRLVPQQGWQRPGVPTLEPLGVALGRYFDRSIPRWDAVVSLPRGELFDEVGIDASAVVESVFQSVATSRPHLTHRRQARDFVAALDPSIAVEWAEGVREGRTGGADVGVGNPRAVPKGKSVILRVRMRNWRSSYAMRRSSWTGPSSFSSRQTA